MTWPTVALGNLAVSIRNGIFARRPTDEPGGSRILRISAVRDDLVNLDDSRFVNGLDPEQISKFSIDPGDLLMTRYNGSRSLVGISGLVPVHSGTFIHPDKLIRVVLDTSRILPAFANYQLSSPAVRSHLEPRIRTTAGQSGIAGADVRSIPLVVPPLDEQRRIVDLLEDHLSRLDAANAYLAAADRRLNALTTAVLLDAIPNVAAYPSTWERSTTVGAGTVELGRQRHPDWHTGPNIRPYLRVANVFEDRIDTSDVMQMHWPEGVFERFQLHDGDVLLNEGQSPDYLGRPAIYRGKPAETAFTNSLIRFRASERVLPEFALVVFRRHMRSGRFKRESRITTNIAHLSAARLKSIEFPIPPLDEQTEIVSVANDQFAAIDRMRAGERQSASRAPALRRSLLASAFSGRLTGEALDISKRVLA